MVCNKVINFYPKVTLSFKYTVYDANHLFFTNNCLFAQRDKFSGGAEALAQMKCEPTNHKWKLNLMECFHREKMGRMQFGNVVVRSPSTILYLSLSAIGWPGGKVRVGILWHASFSLVPKPKRSFTSSSGNSTHQFPMPIWLWMRFSAWLS